MFHANRYICNIINGVAEDPKPGVPGMCVCILHHHKRGTVQTLLTNGKPEFTTRSNGISCLRFNHAVDMAKDILSGLKCMHQMKIVHRDIKPGNICIKLLSSKGEEARLQYIIIDLGAAIGIKTPNEATSEESAENSSDDLAAFTGQFTSVAGQKLPLGTLSFMSPEHIDPSFTVDGRADIFSLGVTIFLCLCGRFPFLQPKTCPDVKLLAIKMLQRYAMAKEADQLKIPYSKGQRRGKEELITIVAKSLRKARKERYETAGAMMKHLERIDG